MSRQVPTEPATYEQLPRSILGRANTRTLDQYDQGQLDAVANNPPPPKPLPADWPEWKKALYGNLAQFKGRTKDGWRNSAGNLTRKVMPDTADHEPELLLPDDAPSEITVPAVRVPPILGGTHTVLCRLTRACVSQDEWHLFVETWNRWFSTHSDYIYAEDEDDVKSICMETVIQTRWMLLQARRPKEYDPKAVHESHLRLQTARENLGARRRDREAAAKGKVQSNTIFNVAILAGHADPKKTIAAREVKLIEAKSQRAAFFAKTHMISESPLGDPNKQDDIVLPDPGAEPEITFEDA